MPLDFGMPRGTRSRMHRGMRSSTSAHSQDESRHGSEAPGLAKRPYHYKYKSGREGDAPAASFAPHKAATTIYLTDGIGRYDQHLKLHAMRNEQPVSYRLAARC